MTIRKSMDLPVVTLPVFRTTRNVEIEDIELTRDSDSATEPSDTDPTDTDPTDTDPTDTEPTDTKPRGTYEVKFLVDRDLALKIIDWARAHLLPDPHAGGEQSDEYEVNSLYLDTPDFDCYHRSGFFRRRKFRVRRYGTESLLWLERKSKQKGRVRKRRVSVAECDLAARLNLPLDEADDDFWFRHRAQEYTFQPICECTYQRFARVGPSGPPPLQAVNGNANHQANGNTNGRLLDYAIRLTVDSNLRARAAHAWQVPSGPLSAAPSLLDDRRVVELKFRDSMPALFHTLIQQMNLEVTSFSKYRTSVEACIDASAIPPAREPSVKLGAVIEDGTIKDASSNCTNSNDHEMNGAGASHMASLQAADTNSVAKRVRGGR